MENVQYRSKYYMTVFSSFLYMLLTACSFRSAHFATKTTPSKNFITSSPPFPSPPRSLFPFCPNPTGKRIRSKTNADPQSVIITSNTNRKTFVIVLMRWKDQTIAEIFAPFEINLWLSKCSFFFSFQLLSIYYRRTLCIFCNVQLNDVINSVLATRHKEKFKWLL